MAREFIMSKNLDVVNVDCLKYFTATYFVITVFVRIVRINFLSVAKRLGTVLRFTSSSYLALNLVRGGNSVIISHNDWERLKTI